MYYKDKNMKICISSGPKSCLPCSCIRIVVLVVWECWAGIQFQFKIISCDIPFGVTWNPQRSHLMSQDVYFLDLEMYDFHEKKSSWLMLGEPYCLKSNGAVFVMCVGALHTCCGPNMGPTQGPIIVLNRSFCLSNRVGSSCRNSNWSDIGTNVLRIHSSWGKKTTVNDFLKELECIDTDRIFIDLQWFYWNPNK